MINKKKYKIIDSVFFEDEIDYLLFRFTELNDSVDLFIVLESTNKSKNSVFLNHLKKFEKWNEKIIHVMTDYPTEDEFSKILTKNKLTKIIVPDLPIKDRLRISQINDLILNVLSLNLTFDDVILISKIDEFPEINEPSILQEYLSFGPVWFSQKNFLWSKDFVNEENHLGTSCYSFSHFICLSQVIFLDAISKDNDTHYNTSLINSGYRFSNFYSVEKSQKKIKKSTLSCTKKELKKRILNSRDNLIYDNFDTKSRLGHLKEYKGNLPTNVHMLDSQKIGRILPKKYMVIIDVDTSFKEGYKTISITSELNSELYYILIPNQKYYDVLIDNNTLENFRKMYFLNEIKKQLTLKFPIDIDIFEFHYEKRIISLSWSDMKNHFIYDLLHE